MLRRPVKCAVLVDFDNIAQIVGASFGDHAPAWVAWLEDGCFEPGGRRRRIVHKLVYWNDHNDPRWRPRFEAAGFEAFTCPSLVRKKKSEADLRLALDAQRLAYEEKGIEEFVILSTDTDFVALLNRLAELERRTIAAANRENASFAVYTKHADIAIPVDELRAACAYRRPTPRWKRWLLWWALKDAASPLAPLMARLRGRVEADICCGADTQITSPELRRAAEIILNIAKDAPGLPVARRTIIRRLCIELPGFQADGPQPFLGCETYCEFLRAVARLRAELRVHFYANGGVAVSYRPEPCPGEQGAAEARVI